MNIEIIELRKLTASEGKILISKSSDAEGNPVVKSKLIYLGINDCEDNYEEIEE